VVRVRVRSAVTGSVVAALVLAGCSSGGSSGGASSLDTIPAAVPATSPSQTAALPGTTTTTVSSPLTATVVVQSTRTLVLAATGPDRLVLLDLDDLSRAARSVPLPAPATQVELAGNGGSVLVALPGAVARVDTASGALTSTSVDGDVTAVLQLSDGRVAAGLGSGTTVLLGPDGTVQASIGGLAGVDDLVGSAGAVVAVDRQQTAAAVLDLGSDSLGLALRAGDGATNAVADRYGRVLVVDTTGGELIALGADPLLMRQRYPVPGAPYGIAYDPTTDLAWVTLTATNQVVGYDVRGGEPVERYRFDTVTQPNSVAVDPAGGAVLVSSATGGGVQRIVPGARG
jgi:DNA-binding beta-propeller fold protein YncE